MDCIFCKIIAGEIPCHKVHEDEDTLAFMDINPLCEGHLLIIPKKHVPNLLEADEGTLEATIRAARKVARALAKALGLDSMNLAQANGPWALQSVQHLHMHLIPRREGDGLPLDWGLSPGNHEDIAKVARQISDSIA